MAEKLSLSKGEAAVILREPVKKLTVIDYKVSQADKKIKLNIEIDFDSHFFNIDKDEVKPPVSDPDEIGYAAFEVNHTETENNAFLFFKPIGKDSVQLNLTIDGLGFKVKHGN